MAIFEADTYVKLVNPAPFGCGWTKGHIQREETTGTVQRHKDGKNADRHTASEHLADRLGNEAAAIETLPAALLHEAFQRLPEASADG